MVCRKQLLTSDVVCGTTDHELAAADGSEYDVVQVVVVVVLVFDDELEHKKSLLMLDSLRAYFSLRRSTYHTSSQFLTIPFSKRIGS